MNWTKFVKDFVADVLLSGAAALVAVQIVDVGSALATPDVVALALASRRVIPRARTSAAGFIQSLDGGARSPGRRRDRAERDHLERSVRGPVAQDRPKERAGALAERGDKSQVSGAEDDQRGTWGRVRPPSRPFGGARGGRRVRAAAGADTGPVRGRSGRGEVAASTHRQTLTCLAIDLQHRRGGEPGTLGSVGATLPSRTHALQPAWEHEFRRTGVLVGARGDKPPRPTLTSRFDCRWRSRSHGWSTGAKLDRRSEVEHPLDRQPPTRAPTT